MSDRAAGLHDPTTTDPATATEPKRADRSLGELFSEMTSDLSELFRKEVQLAKVEATEEAKTSAKAVGSMAAAGVAGLLLLIMASVALALLLDEWMHPALAFLIVAVAWAIVAAVLFAAGRSRLRRVKALPQTTETLKEDMQWAKTLRH